MASDPQLTNALQRLTQIMESMAQVSGLRTSGGLRPGDVDRRQSRSSSTTSADDKAAVERERQLEKYDIIMKKWVKNASAIYTKEHAQIFDDLSKSWQANTDGFHQLQENVQMFRQGLGKLGAQAERLVDGMGRFESSMAKSAKAQSLLYAEQLRNINTFKDFEYSAYLNKLTDAAALLEDGTKKALHLMDDATGKMRTDLNVEDFTRVLRSLGEFDATVKEALSKTGFGSVKDIMASGELTQGRNPKGSLSKADDAIVLLAQIAEAQGWGTKNPELRVTKEDGSLKDAPEILQMDLKALAEELRRTTAGIDVAGTHLKKTVEDFTFPFKRLLLSIQDAEGKKALKGAITDWAHNLSSAALMMKAWQKAQEAYAQAYEFNTAQVNQSLVQTVADSVKMGMSFGDTTKVLQENKRMMAIYGPGQFTTAFGGMQDDFKKFGFTLKQSAELIGPTVETAIAAGVNVRDPGQLTKFTDTMMTAFQSISGVVNISAKEFMDMNKELFKADGAFESLAGMDKERRQQYAQDLVLQRNRYILGGLEKDQAQQLLTLQRQQERESVKSRLSAGAKLMNAAMFSGMSIDDASRLMTLRNKGMRTTAEDDELANLQGTLGMALEQQRVNEASNNNGFTYFSDVFRDSNALESSDQQAMKLGMGAKMAQQAGANTTDAEAKRAGEAAKGSEAFANLATWVDRASNVINSAFLGAIGLSSLSLGVFSYQLSKASMRLSDFGGGGGPGALADALGGGGKNGGGGAGRAGKWGTALKWGGRLLEAAPWLIEGGMALSSMTDVQNAQKAGTISDTEAAKQRAGIFGGLAGGGAAAMIGGGIGQVLIPIPGVGFAVGAALGGLAGGYLGNAAGSAIGGMFGSDSKSASNKQLIPAEGINTPAQEGINQQTLNVVDKGTLEQLIALNATMTKAAESIEKLTMAQE
jgi:hypothetical protein